MTQRSNLEQCKQIYVVCVYAYDRSKDDDIPAME